MLAILTPLAAPLASSTRFINNTCAYSYTVNIAPKAFAANKYKKPTISFPSRPPKFN
jgi:hypothetical protein